MGLQDTLESLGGIGADFVEMTVVNANSRHVKSGIIKREIAKHLQSRIEFELNKAYDPDSLFQPGIIMSLKSLSLPKQRTKYMNQQELFN